MPEFLLIRADASAHIGTGHVMRCIALGQVWQRAGGNVVFALADSTPALDQRLLAEGFQVKRIKGRLGSKDDAAETNSLAREIGASWVVADGYHFDAAYQAWIKEAGLQLLVVDDFGHASRYYADVVLNQNLGAHANLYSKREPNTKLLLGTSYCMLRREFLKWREWRRHVPDRAARVLVTMGGADPDNVTGKVIEGIKTLRCVEAVVVVGGSNPNLESLRTASTGAESTIRLVINTSEMPQLMAAADLAIAAGGTTAWELAFMGLPALTIVLAENQRSNGDQLQAMGLVQNLGWHADLSPESIARAVAGLIDNSGARAEMSQHGRALVDGLGSFRVWLHLHEHTLQLRNATEVDSPLIWQWANHPAVRAVSFSSEPIPWENHESWFRGKLADSGCHFWIATDQANQPVGQVRFETSGEETVISVSLHTERRGSGLGALLIWAACRKLFCETPVSLIRAWIKPGNTASIRAFEKAGFEPTGEVSVRGNAALGFQLTRLAAET